MSPVYKTDVIIIGAGPVGLFAVFQCGMLGLSCHVVDALPALGGQCTALYPEKPIYDIAAHPEIMAGDLITGLVEQAEPFAPEYHLNQQVTALREDKDTGRFTVTTAQGVVIDAAAVFIAAGPGAFGPNKPPIKGIESFENFSVHYMVGHKDIFAGQTLVIAGGGDSAVDWALSLSDIAEKIYLVHRRDKFRAAPDSVARLNHLAETGKIEKCIPYQPYDLKGRNGELSAVTLRNLNGETRDIAADHLLCFYGLAQDLGPIREWGLNIEKYQIPIDSRTAQTDRRGIYAIGDVATYDHKLKLITTGFAEAAQAAHHAFGIARPDAALHFEYSTTKGIPDIKDGT